MGLSLDIHIPRNPIVGKIKKTQETIWIWDNIINAVKMRTPPIFLNTSWNIK